MQTLLDSQSTVTMQDCVDARPLRPLRLRAPDDQLLHGRRASSARCRGRLEPDAPLRREQAHPGRARPRAPARDARRAREASRKIVASGAAKHGMALPDRADYLNEFFYAKAGQQLRQPRRRPRRRGRRRRCSTTRPVARSGRWWKDMVDSGLALNTGSAPKQLRPPARDRHRRRGHGDRGVERARHDPPGARERPVPRREDRAGPLPSLTPGAGCRSATARSGSRSRRRPAKQAAAWEFAKFLWRRSSRRRSASATGYVPVRKSAAAMPSRAGVLGRSSRRSRSRTSSCSCPGGQGGERIGHRQLPGRPRRGHRRAHGC